METSAFFKENAPPFLQNGSSFRKQVRFESDHRFDEVQNPKPYDPYFITKNGFGSGANEKVAQHPTMSVPKPSDDLELSILCTNSNNNSPQRCNDYKPTESQRGFLEKTAPYKSSFATIQTDDPRLLNYPHDKIELASKSHKDFKINDSNQFGGFFTKPNSNSKYSNMINCEPVQVNNKTLEYEKCSCCQKLKDAESMQPEMSNCGCHGKKKVKQAVKTKKNCNCNCSKFKNPVAKEKMEKKIASNGLEEKSLAIMKNIKLLNGLNESETILDETEANDSDSNSEPTIMDLYKIIMLQNEQLRLLQQRMDQLSIQKLPVESQTLNATSSHHKRIEVVENNIQMNNDELHKISIGVMTSFEVVMHSKETRDDVLKINHVDECVQTSCFISRAQNQMLPSKPGHKNNNILSDIINDQATNFKIPSKTNDKEQSRSRKVDQTDMSCLATESLIQKLQRTQSPPLSPQPSIHVNMDDYSDSEDECSRPNIGWTFYNKVMNNVDNMLEKSELNYIRTKRLPPNKVLNIGETNTSKRVTFESRNANMLPKHDIKVPSEASIHMKKLASKYLGTSESVEPEYTSPLTNGNVTKNQYSNDLRNDMSFSTLQYMQRNQLISTPTFNNILPKKPTKESLYPQNNYPQTDKRSPRILDITSIKQQPKLT